MKRRRLIRKSLYALLTLVLVANVMAVFHAWKFTHFEKGAKKRVSDEMKLSFGEKVSAMLFGVALPRPENTTTPDAPYQTILLPGSPKTACWMIPADLAIGTVVICHGYGGSKGSMLDKAGVFRQLHYNTLLPDFMGAGGSDGNTTTIGYKEAAQVAGCVDYLHTRGERNIVLFGTSMGAAAIMKAAQDSALPVRALILECPFGTMLRTVENRFDMVGAPAFPMAQLLVFWGGAINGFNAFKHNPETYAQHIRMPALLMRGADDPKVSAEETGAIFTNLEGPKQLVIFPRTGHTNYLTNNRPVWTAAIDSFLTRHAP